MRKYQKELDRWFQKHGWEYWPPLEILAQFFEESGEFARIVSYLHGSKKKKPREKQRDLEEEIGDIIYALICYANSQGIDLDRAIRKSFRKVARRDTRRFKKT